MRGRGLWRKSLAYRGLEELTVIYELCLGTSYEAWNTIHSHCKPTFDTGRTEL